MYSVIIDCIKTSKGLCKAQTPRTPFWTLISDLRKLEKHRPSSKTLCNKLDVLYSQSIIRLYKPLKRSSNPTNSERAHSLDPLVSGPPKTRKPQTFKCKSICNKLGIMFKMYSYILLWVHCMNLSRDRKSNKLGEGSFFGPPGFWDPENPQKPTLWDSHFC